MKQPLHPIKRDLQTIKNGVFSYVFSWTLDGGLGISWDISGIPWGYKRIYKQFQPT
jgi:hypothetical protein